MTRKETCRFLAIACAGAALGYGLFVLIATRLGMSPAECGPPELISYDGYAVLGFLATAAIFGLCSVDWQALSTVASSKSEGGG